MPQVDRGLEKNCKIKVNRQIKENNLHFHLLHHNLSLFYLSN